MQRSHRLEFDVAWDEEGDVAYLSPSGRSSRLEVVKTVPIVDRAHQLYGTIDLSADGELIGIEMIGARRLLPGVAGGGRGTTRSGE